MDQEEAELAINKLIPFIKPDEVTDILFEIRHSSPDSFTLYATFVVPEEWWNNLDHINQAAFAHKTKMKLRRDIKNFAGINVVFDKDNTNFIPLK